MRLLNEDDVIDIIERVTNDAIEKRQHKSTIQQRLVGEIAILDSVDAEPVKGWISVKERLPEEDGKYMVWYKGELDICEFDAESQTFGYTYDEYDEMYSHLVCWDDSMDKNVTHWMPLPEAPKRGDEE